DLDRYLGPAATALLVLALVAYVWRVVTWRASP
ncbi:MAG: DedA family protein, partial [Novosphingobium sp.]|nr:DedA family protein [Novosphingobium sp.]